MFGLAQSGVPASWRRPVATLFGVPAPCESDLDCGNCEDCRHWYGAEVKTCGYLCQAPCSKCSAGQCVDTCPSCQTCYPNTEQPGATCQSVEDILGCKTCDAKTGKLSDSCSTCERCVGKECVTNCPGRCETCDNGNCRKCDERKCEFCDDAGKCYTCDPTCERCDPRTGTCETRCKNGLTCCAGQCINCCGGCDQGQCTAGGDESCLSSAVDPACCGESAPTCHDLDSDNRHCGACDHPCRLNQSCQKGRCLCEGVREPGVSFGRRGGGMECAAADHECCDGYCVDMASYQSDPNHCGKCIVQCEKDQKCVKGLCIGSKRAGYQVSYRMRRTSEKRGVHMDVTLQATVRALPAADKEGHTLAGWGTYEGYIKNCANQTLPLVGRARGTASASSTEPGQIFLTFVITPLDPPKLHIFFEGGVGLKEEDVPDALGSVIGPLNLRGGRGQDRKSLKMPDGCGGMGTDVTEWEAKKIQ